MGTRYLLDTNCVIYYLKGILPKTAKDIIDKDLIQSPHLSVISKIELLGWQPDPENALDPVEKFINASTILPLNDIIVEKTIEIRRNKKIKLPDAVIAATALVHGFAIISRNKSDFAGIIGLNCYDPFKDL